MQMMPAILQPVIEEGPLKGMPSHTEFAISQGLSPREIRHEFIKRLAKERAIADDRIEALKELPCPEGENPLAWIMGSPELEASIERAFA